MKWLQFIAKVKDVVWYYQNNKCLRPLKGKCRQANALFYYYMEVKNKLTSLYNPSSVSGFACLSKSKFKPKQRHINRFTQLFVLFHKDCCLCTDDIEFLAFHWRPICGLYELNISRNNLARVSEATLAHLFWETCFSHIGHLTCLSLAYTCLPFERLHWILRLFAKEIEISVNLHELR